MSAECIRENITKLIRERERERERASGIEHAWSLDFWRKFFLCMFSSFFLQNHYLIINHMYQSYCFIYDWLKLIDWMTKGSTNQIEKYLQKFMSVHLWSYVCVYFSFCATSNGLNCYNEFVIKWMMAYCNRLLGCRTSKAKSRE